jgi:PAS domain S-box-containing protein
MNPAAHTVAGANGIATLQAGWWKAIFEGAEDILLVCEAGGRILAANARARRLLQPDHAEPHLANLLTKPIEAKVLEWLRLPDARPLVISSAMIVASGHLCMLADLHLTPLGNRQGQIAIKDASRRWRMESHVQRLATAIDSTPDVFFLTDAELRLTFVNAAFQNVTGHGIEEALGRQADFLRAPGQEEKVAEYLRLVHEGKDWTGELINRRQDGSEYPVAATISPVFGQEGEFLGYVSNEREISAWKRVQHQLQREHDLVHSILNSLDSAIYTLDRDFRLTHTNEGWKRMPAAHGWLHLSHLPEAGQNLLDYVAQPGRREELKKLFEQVLATGAPHERQDESDGHFWNIKIYPWMHGGGVGGLIYHVMDQTGYHELLQQWFRAQKLASISALAAGVAHDFNGLLLTMRSHCDQLKEDAQLPEAARQKVAGIAEAAERATCLTQQLISYSRVREERATTLDLNEAIRKTVQMCRGGLPANVKVTFKAAGEPVLVTIDPARAQQMLLNLCTNALESMPNGGKLTLATQIVELTAEQTKQMAAGGQLRAVQCCISDTGCGMVPEVRNRMFEPFFTTKPAGEAAGLGLAFVDKVVQGVGGFISVDSIPGAGTTVRLYLPLTSPPPPSPPTPAKQAANCRLMVVEDMEMVRTFTCDFLRAAGLDAVPAENAREALELLQHDDRFDIIMTDLNMPEMNGIELIRQARLSYPNLRFILCSGFLEEREDLRLHDLAAVRTLAKPYTLKEVLAVIAEVAGQPR